MNCILCDSEKVEIKNGTYVLGTIEIHNASWYECQECGEKFTSLDMELENEKKYIAQNSLLSSTEIKKYRKMLRLSQKDLAEMLSVSRITIARWESGNYIQPVDKNEEIKRVFQNEKNEIDKKQFLDNYFTNIVKNNDERSYGIAAYSNKALSNSEINKIQEFIKRNKK
jgi:YgiT-type zinc finger domain-containing protein